ncbi:MAG TPA: zinc-dependent metalloprotease, partial [Burkholderiaceae bacterium]|nr:zinc-dependent metalloprotease [Burkholderiaceae bacterium]
DGIVEFRRIHNQIQLLWRNTEFVARPGSPESFAVDAAFSPSLLASAAVLSQPHPERKSVLVDANTIFVADLLGTATQLQRTYRQGYAFDTRNSAITALRNAPEATTIEVLNHFATGAIAPAQAAQAGMPVPSVPRSLPDARSLFMTMHYTLARLPAQPLRPRLADARIGHFTVSVVDFADDIARNPRQRYVSRWKLEKKDPAAALSEPVKPITFWIDRTVPHKYRAAVTAGVLEWNRAFEAIGFKDALRVEVQGADADFDTLDHGRASIRWMTNSRPSFGGLGQRHVDPRTGEILHAAIALESLDARNVRSVRSQILAPPLAAEASAPHAHGADCAFAELAAEQLAYALEVLDVRGEIDPASPQAQKWVEDYVRQVTLHEVGHALGLRHNFRASRAYTVEQLADPEFTAANGTTASAMEYMPINLAVPRAPQALQGRPFSTVIGPYDFWAIEYAYRPFALEEESAALAGIAARSAEPLLAFGTDEDASLGIDPEVLQLDLGSDVVAFARTRIAVAQDMLRRQETRQPRPDQGFVVLRRAVIYAVNDVNRAANMLARQIGGLRTLRDAPGSGRDPLQPVPAAQQRAALELITGELLAADSLRVSPALQRRLAPDFQARRESLEAGEGAGTDLSVSTQVLDMQRGLLATLMSDVVAVRLLDSAEKSAPGAQASL